VAESGSVGPTGSRYDRDEARPGEVAFSRAAAAQYAVEHGAVEVVNTATALALRMDRPFLVLTNEGAMRGEAGDYLMVRGVDDAWPLKAEFFDGNYRQV
jgi:hypothetical protein